MTDGMAQQAIQAALQRLVAQLAVPRALTLQPGEHATLLRAVERAAAQLLGATDTILTIALAGCSGAGKSTLTNALAGATIAEVSEQRPCTMQTKVYHHSEVPGGGLPPELAAHAVFTAHDRPELRYKVIVDTPDLDTFATQNRMATKALLKAAGLVVYVFSPERYLEERGWSVIREEQRFSACVALINKADTVPPHELEQTADEIRRRFAAMGKPDLKVLRVCAAKHVPGPDGQFPPPDPMVVDEFASLRAYLEHELNTGDIAQMRRAQQARVIDNLRTEVACLVPQEAIAGLDALATTARQRAEAAGGVLSDALADRLAAIETDLGALAAIRRHQRFRGPFRTWLALADFCRYGLPRLVRRLRYVSNENEQSASVATILVTGKTDLVSDLLIKEAQQLQDLCFKSHLPIGRWRAVTAVPSGDRLLGQAAAELEARYEAAAAAVFGKSKWLIGGASWLGALVPGGLVLYGLIQLVINTGSGTYTGFAVLGQILSLILFFYLILHGIVTLTLAGSEVFAVHGLGPQTIHDLLKRTLEGWVATYRADIEADWADLREPLNALQAALSAVPVNMPRSPVSRTPFSGVPPLQAGQGAVASLQRIPATDADSLGEQEEVRAPLTPAPSDPSLLGRTTTAGKLQKTGQCDPPLENQPQLAGLSAAEHLRRAIQRQADKQSG